MSLNSLAPMHRAHSPHSKVMVGMIPTISHGIWFSVPSQLLSTGAIVCTMVLILSHMMEMDWFHDG